MIIFYIITAAIVLLIVIMFVLNKPEDENIRILKDKVDDLKYKTSTAPSSFLTIAKEHTIPIVDSITDAYEENKKNRKNNKIIAEAEAVDQLILNEASANDKELEKAKEIEANLKKKLENLKEKLNIDEKKIELALEEKKLTEDKKKQTAIKVEEAKNNLQKNKKIAETLSTDESISAVAAAQKILETATKELNKAEKEDKTAAAAVNFATDSIKNAINKVNEVKSSISTIGTTASTTANITENITENNTTNIETATLPNSSVATAANYEDLNAISSQIANINKNLLSNDIAINDLIRYKTIVDNLIESAKTINEYNTINTNVNFDNLTSDTKNKWFTVIESNVSSLIKIIDKNNLKENFELFEVLAHYKISQINDSKSLNELITPEVENKAEEKEEETNNDEDAKEEKVEEKVDYKTETNDDKDDEDAKEEEKAEEKADYKTESNDDEDDKEEEKADYKTESNDDEDDKEEEKAEEKADYKTETNHNEDDKEDDKEEKKAEEKVDYKTETNDDKDDEKKEEKEEKEEEKAEEKTKEKVPRVRFAQSGGNKQITNFKASLLYNEEPELLQQNKALQSEVIETFIENLLMFYTNNTNKILKNNKDREKEINNLEIILSIYEDNKILSKEKQIAKVYTNVIKLINILYDKTTYWKYLECDNKSYKDIINIIHNKYLSNDLKTVFLPFSKLKFEDISLFKMNLLDKLSTVNTLDLIANIKLNLYCNIVNLNDIIDNYVKIYKTFITIDKCKTIITLKKIYNITEELIDNIKFTNSNYKNKIANKYEELIIKDLNIKENLRKELKNRIKQNIILNCKEVDKEISEYNFEKQYSNIIGLYEWLEDNKSKSGMFLYKNALEKYFKMLVDKKMLIKKPNKDIILDSLSLINKDSIKDSEVDLDKWKTSILMNYKHSSYNNDLSYKKLVSKIEDKVENKIRKPKSKSFDEYIKFNNKNYLIKNDKISSYIEVNNAKKYLCKVENKYNFIN